MVKISQDPSKVPKWLDVHQVHLPDFVARDPKKYKREDERGGGIGEGVGERGGSESVQGRREEAGCFSLS